MLSLLDLLGPDAQPPEAPLLGDEAPMRPNHDDPKGFELTMKRKRRAALLMAMLRGQGYDDLARMASVREHGRSYVD